MATYTNSSLVKYTKLSPNNSGQRTHAIDTITIHCVAGHTTIEKLGDLFYSSSREASSNYGIGDDGRVGMYVEEKNRSWCSSNAANDQRAITIEVSSDATAPYKVNDTAYAALIDLVTDVCKRNGIAKLIWSTNKSDRVNHVNGCNMTVHRDYANKSCPGEYLYNLHGTIADEVNKRLNGGSSTTTTTSSTTTTKPITSSKLLKNGSKGDAVKTLQTNLNKIGYSLAADGIFGAKTEAAVRQFQTSKGLSVDGIVGEKTLAAITTALNTVKTNPYTEPTTNIKFGARGNGVKWIQQALVNKGYIVTVDGIFGNDTNAKVRSFQKNNGLSVDGIVGVQTRAKLK